MRKTTKSPAVSAINAQSFPAIQTTNGEQTVDARALHLFLNNKRQFADWIKQRIAEFGFVEGEDFLLHKFVKQKNGRGGHNKDDYHLMVDMAKELCMVEKNDFGKAYRRYLIASEKKLQAQHIQPVYALAEEASLPIDELFVTRIGDHQFRQYYSNGILWAQCTSVFGFLNYNPSVPALVERFGEHCYRQIAVGKQMVWFLNYEGFNMLTLYTAINLKGTKIDAVKKQLFRIKLEREESAFQYSHSDMLKIVAAINKRPLNRQDVIDLLLNPTNPTL